MLVINIETLSDDLFMFSDYADYVEGKLPSERKRRKYFPPQDEKGKGKTADENHKSYDSRRVVRKVVESKPQTTELEGNFAFFRSFPDS